MTRRLMNLQREYKRIQDRIDAMYLDKLDGRIDADFFDRNSQGWRAKQQQIMNEINGHRAANQSYIEEGIELLQLAQRARQLFEKQPARQKRRLLDFVLSNSTWKDGELTAEYSQPFAFLADGVTAEQAVQTTGAARGAQNENWLPGMDSNHELDRFLKPHKLFYKRECQELYFSHRAESRARVGAFSPLGWLRASGVCVFPPRKVHGT